MRAPAPDRRADPPGAAGEEGVVLILVLAILVFTIGSTYAFARRSLLEISSSQARIDRARADLLARSGIAIGVRAILDAAGPVPQLARERMPEPEGVDSARAGWSLLGRSEIRVQDGRLRVRVRDGGSRIALNGLIDAEGQALEGSRDFLRAAFERIVDQMPGRAEEKPYEPEELADTLLDWMDADDRTRLNDSEAEFYASRDDRGATRSVSFGQAGTAGSEPLDRPLWSLAELAGAPGFDALLLVELEHYFTPHPTYPKQTGEGGGAGGVNPNTAPPHILGLMYYGVTGDRRLLDEDDVFRLLRLREEGLALCPPGQPGGRCTTLASELGRDGSAFPPVRFASVVFEIESVGQVRGARSCVSRVIERGQDELTTLDYRLGC